MKTVSIRVLKATYQAIKIEAVKDDKTMLKWLDDLVKKELMVRTKKK